METPQRRPRSNDYRYADERLQFVIRASGLSVGLFAREIGMTDGAEELYRIRRGQAPLSEAVVRQIHARFPQIDPAWLLTGHVGESRSHHAGDPLTEHQ